MAAMTMPTTLPPTSTSESAPPSAPATCARRGPSDSEYSPAANRAGRPAPARSPKTRIFHSALRLIHDMLASPLLALLRPQPSRWSGSAGATVPVHSAFTLLWSTLVLRDRQ